MPHEFPCKYGCGTMLHYDRETHRVADSSNAYHWCPNFPKSKDVRIESSLTELVQFIVDTVNRKLQHYELDLNIRERIEN